MNIKFDPKLYEKDKLYGTTTVGARGQVVIPVTARKDLKLKTGDQLLVIGKQGKALGLVKAEDLAEMVEMLMKNITQDHWRKKIKEYVVKMFGDINALKKGKK